MLDLSFKLAIPPLDSCKGRVNQYIQLVKVLYCKLPTNGKQLPAFPLEVGPGSEPRSQRWECYNSVTMAPRSVFLNVWKTSHKPSCVVLNVTSKRHEVGHNAYKGCLILSKPTLLRYEFHFHDKSWSKIQI